MLAVVRARDRQRDGSTGATTYRLDFGDGTPAVSGPSPLALQRRTWPRAPDTVTLTVDPTDSGHSADSAPTSVRRSGRDRRHVGSVAEQAPPDAIRPEHGAVPDRRVRERRQPLLYSARLVRSPMIEPGEGWAYARPLLRDRLLPPGDDPASACSSATGSTSSWEPSRLRDRRLPRRGRESGTVMIYRLVSRFLKTIE